MKTIRIGQTTYKVPTAHVRSISREPHQFVRIKAPDRSFELIYDSRAAGGQDAAGFPVIFSLNEEAVPGIHRHLRGDLMVVCRQAVHPIGGCGLKVEHRGAEWTVLFPEGRLGSADVIRREAIEAMAAYESQRREK